MPSTFTVAPARPMDRWSVATGEPSTFELQVTSDSDAPMLCSLTVDDPLRAGEFNPNSFTLVPREPVNVQLTFPAGSSVRAAKRVLITLRGADGGELTRLERELTTSADATASGAGNGVKIHAPFDCALSLAWREADVEDGEVCGFRLSCGVRNIGATAGQVALQFARHPALRFDVPSAMTLAPGASLDLPVIVGWNRDASDMIGKNHPSKIEAFVDVASGRRSAMLPWDVIERECARQATSTPPAAALAAPPLAAAVIAATQSATVEQARPPQPKVDQGRLLQLPAEPAPRPREGIVQQRVTNQPPPASALASAVTIVEEPIKLARNSAGGTRVHARRDPAIRHSTLILSLFGLAAIVFAVLYFVRPGTQAPTQVAIVTPSPLAASQVAPVITAQAPKKVTTKPRAAATTTAAASAAPLAIATLPAATPAPASAANAKHIVASAPQLRTQRVARRLPEQLGPITPVSLFSVYAQYAPGGRGVRVYWTSTGQALAQVQVTDATGRLISARIVRGAWQTALMYLPRSYRGPVYVQVISIGRSNDRVTQSASLPTFGT